MTDNLRLALSSIAEAIGTLDDDERGALIGLIHNAPSVVFGMADMVPLRASCSHDAAEAIVRYLALQVGSIPPHQHDWRWNTMITRHVCAICGRISPTQ